MDASVRVCTLGAARRAVDPEGRSEQPKMERGRASVEDVARSVLLLRDLIH